MEKNNYLKPAISTHWLTEESIIANSITTNIDGLKNGGDALDTDEAGVKGSSDSFWDDDFSQE